MPGRTFASTASERGSLDWAGGTERALILPLSHSTSLITLFALVPPALGPRPLMCALLLLSARVSARPPSPRRAGPQGAGPAASPGGLRVWRIPPPPPPFLCRSIIDRISSACCTRRAHGIFCSNRAARFPRSTPVCRGRGARERAAAQCRGQCQRCAPRPSLAATPLPRRPPGTALHCRCMPEWGRAGFGRCHPPSPPPRRCSWPGGSIFMDGGGCPSGSCIPSNGGGGISLV